MKDWSLERLKRATKGSLIAEYEGFPENFIGKELKKSNPDIFKFKAISVGDKEGQCFLVPLDESSEETCNLILKAIQFYDPHSKEEYERRKRLYEELKKEFE